nr:NAD(P)-binding domain-containing protein [Thermoanaerobaculia bacterium]
LKPTVKYWLKPDVENRIAEQALEARWNTRVLAFQPPEEGRQGGVEVEGPGGRERLKADAVYLLIGYRPDLSLLAGTGVAIDPETLVPEHDEASCETNVPGFYIAGTLLAGKATNRLFIENTRDHGERIVSHLLSRRARATVP